MLPSVAVIPPETRRAVEEQTPWTRRDGLGRRDAQPLQREPWRWATTSARLRGPCPS